MYMDDVAVQITISIATTNLAGIMIRYACAEWPRAQGARIKIQQHKTQGT
jgi:hypothetical protein